MAPSKSHTNFPSCTGTPLQKHSSIITLSSLVYQPQVDLQRNEISGVEALTRWEHPKLGLYFSLANLFHSRRKRV